LRLERAILRAVFRKGGMGILNDLTNCLRYGDITVPIGGKFLLIEAKSGKSRTPHGERQETKMRKISDYLLCDRTNELYGSSGDFSRLPLDGKEVHHRPQLNETIRLAWASFPLGLV
jgi:hypothetical protein